MSSTEGAKRGRSMHDRQNNTLMQVEDASKLEAKRKALLQRHTEQMERDLDFAFGYDRYTNGPALTGFIFNLNVISLTEDETKHTLTAVEFYLVRDDGSTFKAVSHVAPYFLLKVSDELTVPELEEWASRRFEGRVKSVEALRQEDLDLPNHLSGLQQVYMKVSFRNMDDLNSVRRVVLSAVSDNERRAEADGLLIAGGSLSSGRAARFAEGNNNFNNLKMSDKSSDSSTNRNGFRNRRPQPDAILRHFLDIREHDLPYSQRLLIVTGIRVGKWYDVEPNPGSQTCSFRDRSDLVERPLMKVMAWDIETSKSPLKFPNAEVDPIIMVSLMLDGRGLLIVNREIVSQDIDAFEYTPKPEYEGIFEVINCSTEKETIEAFFQYIRETKPQIFVTYNGDYFDWPFVDKRAEIHGISLSEELGITYDEPNAEYKGRFSVHLDAFAWVKRDSYLPQGSHGLKAVTKAKLKYDPIELDPEDMLPFASERPQVLASYSVSDAVATYYLYMKYIHLFIFSLCMIIPMPPSDVLRKGSGTLCEMLLLVEAYTNNVVAPNKQMEKHIKFHKGHLLESETYIGGHVECLNSGIYRSDIPIEFNLNPVYLQMLMEQLDFVCKFTIEEEGGGKIAHCTNLEEVKMDIITRLVALRDKPSQTLAPMIYHLDVGAMYPNIILTNRLQPYAMVTKATCASCDFNVPENDCQRTMKWAWRGKYFVASRSDFSGVETSLIHEVLTPEDMKIHKARSFETLKEEEQAVRIKKRLKAYCQRVYKKLTEEKVEERAATICQREHPFYVDTVKAFRDRRYDYKRLNKEWNQNLAAASDALEQAVCRNMILLYDSMQLAHKCILNSFYGYVMRKGSRWSSMEMAGVVTKTGATLIQEAEKLVQAVGKVLELDTDGIWCVLPSSFPDNYTFKCVDPETGIMKKINMNYPCSVLNASVNMNFTNNQYQTLVDERTREYTKTSECSIFFEVDGPYKAMVLPASQHEGKNIKKRYAVFNPDDSLAELKGFEIKRRGELKIIKVFQSEVFGTFLRGNSLTECYKHVGIVCDRWLDVLYSRGADLEDEDVFELISENKNMSDTLESYGDARSTSITCARRLGEFLGAEMVKDKGLNVKFIVSKLPEGASVSDRAVPVAIFSAEPSVRRHYLRRWLKDGGLSDAELDIRAILDWDYYVTRLSSTIQKIVTIPAAFQNVANPVPRVVHPDWLVKALMVKNDRSKQVSLSRYFTKTGHENGNKDEKNMVEIDRSDSIHAGELLPAQVAANAAHRVAGAFQPLQSIHDIEDFPEEGMSHHDTSSRIRKKHLAVTTTRRITDFTSNHEESKENEDEDDVFHASTSVSDVIHASSSSFLERELDLGEPPSIEADYRTWLRWQQKFWALERAKHKATITTDLSLQDTTQTNSDTHTQKNTLSIPRSLEMKKASGPTSRVLWQILQALPRASSPGLFTVWALATTTAANTPPRIVRTTVRVPRQFYLNSLKPLPANDGNILVKRTLPRMRRPHYLYQVEVPEQSFQEQREALNDYLSSPDVDGVFEMEIPLSFHLLLTLGAITEPQIDSIQHTTSRNNNRLPSLIDPVAVSKLEFNPSSLLSLSQEALLEVPRYLSLGTCPNLTRLFFFHQAADHGRHFFALLPLVPPSAASHSGSNSNGYVQRGVVVLLGPGAKAERLNPSLLLQKVAKDIMNDVAVADEAAREDDIRAQEQAYHSARAMEGSLGFDEIPLFRSTAKSPVSDQVLGQTVEMSSRGLDMRRIFTRLAGLNEFDGFESISRVSSESTAHATHNPHNPHSTHTPAVSINLQTFTLPSEALNFLQSSMTQFKEQSEAAGSAVIMIAQCSETPHQLSQLFPALPFLFPIISMPSAEVDVSIPGFSSVSSSEKNEKGEKSENGIFQLPSLQWGTAALLRSFRKFFLAHDWWIQHTALAHYAKVPMGNLFGCSPAAVMIVPQSSSKPSPEHLVTHTTGGSKPTIAGRGDVLIFLLDVLFARALRASNHVLWASTSPLPDLGGIQESDALYCALEDEHTNPEVSIPGCYREACVDVDLGLFAINAIITHVTPTEGSIGMDAVLEGIGMGAAISAAASAASKTSAKATITATGTEVYGTQSTSLSFGVLQSLASSLFATLSAVKKVDTMMASEMAAINAALASSKEADDLISHLHRWLQSTDSLLYDPLLRRYVRDVTRNSFTHFIARLTKLKCKPVYATYRRLIFPTGRTSSSRSLAFVRYVLETIKSRTEYSILQMNPKRVFDSLLFLDIVNYSTVESGLEHVSNHGNSIENIETENTENIEKSNDDDDNGLVVVSNWHISQYLPPLAKEAFHDIIKVFLLAPALFLRNVEKEIALTTAVERAETLRGYVRELLEHSLQSTALAFLDEVRPPEDGVYLEHLPDAVLVEGLREWSATQGYIPELVELVEAAKSSEIIESEDVVDQDTIDFRHTDVNVDDRNDIDTIDNTSGDDSMEDMEDLEDDDLDVVLARKARSRRSKTSQTYKHDKHDKHDKYDDGDDDEDQEPHISHLQNGNSDDDDDDDDFVVDDMLDVDSVAYTSSTRNYKKNKKMKNTNKNDNTHHSLSDFPSPSASEQFAKQVAWAKAILPRLYHAGVMRYSKRQFEFPLLPGSATASAMSSSDPGIEFAKTLSHVLSLDYTVSDITTRVRENLLLKACGPSAKLFSPELRFEDPCSTYLLPDVVCTACAHSHDLDVCRDRCFIPRNLETGKGAAWECEFCGENLDRRMIEAALLAVLRRREAYYQVQDLFCGKCASIRQNALSVSCRCSSDYVSAKAPGTFVRQLHILRDIAVYCDFYALKDRVEWLLSLAPSAQESTSSIFK